MCSLNVIATCQLDFDICFVQWKVWPNGGAYFIFKSLKTLGFINQSIFTLFDTKLWVDRSTDGMPPLVPTASWKKNRLYTSSIILKKIQFYISNQFPKRQSWNRIQYRICLLSTTHEPTWIELVEQFSTKIEIRLFKNVANVPCMYVECKNYNLDNERLQSKQTT